MADDDFSTSDDNTTANDYITPLAEDNDTPFGPPDDPVQDATVDTDIRTQQGRLDPTHQATDSASDIDSQQLYDEGLAGAAEASEPNAGNTVVGYDPSRDQRQQ